MEERDNEREREREREREKSEQVRQNYIKETERVRKIRGRERERTCE